MTQQFTKVDLETLKRVHPIRDRANGVYSSASYEVDGYNRAIDDIKAKYGDLWSGYEQDIPVAQETANDLENVTCAGLSNADERQAVIEKALRIAFIIGQDYWSDADSESWAASPIRWARAWKRADKHKEKLELLIEETSRAALQSPRIPVIDGLDEALNKYTFDMPDISDYLTVGEYLDDEAAYRKASYKVEKAARAYAELQKGD